MTVSIEDIDSPPNTCTAFSGVMKIAEGTIADVAATLSAHLKQHPETNYLIFDNRTSAPIEIDLRGTTDDVLSRLGGKSEDKSVKTGPGRPKLGVVSREIGLLPRQWEWLSSQPGGASVTLRKLVDEARKANRSRDEKREAQTAAYKFMSAMAGNLPHYEEALRAFYAGNKALFETLSHAWPEDVRNHSYKLAERAF